MNRHQRRARAAKRQDHQQWLSGIQQVHDEAAGMLEMVVIRPPELEGLLAVATQTNRAGKLASLAMRTILDVHHAPVGDPVQCMACCRAMTLHIPCSVVLAFPSRDNPTKALASVMCASCATRPDEIQAKAIEALRDTWPDLRPVTIAEQAGHA